MAISTAVGDITARNNTSVELLVDGNAVGRIQQFTENVDNNVQVLAELGRDYMVEMQKGVTEYSFTVNSFYVKSDVMDDLKAGVPFTLSITENGTETVTHFDKCMLDTLKRSYTVGQAAIGQEATIRVIGTPA